MNNKMGQIEGVLYRGDKMTKYSGNNSPVNSYYVNVNPEELAFMAKFPNQQQSGKVMMHMIDFDADVRQVLPSVPTTDELVQWPISPDRHQAYEYMWRAFAYAGVLANTAMWLYW